MTSEHNETPRQLTFAKMLMTSSALLSCLILPSQVLAQETPPSDAASDTTEVIITAQKRTERLKDVTVAASVVDSAALSRGNATDISDLNKIVPSLSLKASFNGRVPLAMRGVSTTANEATFGLTSGVAILIDGVPTSSDSMAASQLSDVARVEVLKGPQSTLGGRAASAGVINVVTLQPTKTFTADGSVLATDDHQYRVEGFVSGPLSPDVLGSLSFFDDHTRYPMQNLLTGKYTTTDGAGGRGKLKITPTDDLSITLSLRHSYLTSNGNNFVYNYLTPGAHLLGIGAPFMSQAVNLPGVDIDFDNTKYTTISGALSRIRDTDYSVNVDWSLGNYTLSSTSAVQHEKQYNRQDVPEVATYFFDVLTGGMAPHYGNIQEIWEDITTTSQEFKIASPSSDPINFVAGLFYSDTNVKATYDRNWVANPLIKDILSDTKTYGLYARVNWRLGDNWKLITGLRSNYDDVSYVLDQTADNAAGAFYSEGDNTSTTTVGDVTLQKVFSRDVMAYATYSKGYKPAAYNTAQQLLSNDALQPVSAEDINHVELGTKGSYFNRRLALNASLFHTQYKNYQVQIYDFGAGWPAPLKLDNAGEAKTEGLELDLTWRATPTLTLGLNAAFIDAKFVSYQGASCYNAQTAAEGCITVLDGSGGTVSQSQDLSGKTMANAPKSKINLTFDKHFVTDRLPFEVNVGGTYSWSDKFQMQADQNPETIQPAFGILNLSVTATPKNSHYSLTLFVNNVTDQYYTTNMEDFWSGIWGTANAVIAQPARDSHRYVGVRLNASF